MKALRHSQRRLLRVLSAVGIFVALSATTSFAGSITVTASPTQITDQGEEAIFTIHVSPAPLGRRALNFFMSGTAIMGSDYVLFGSLSRGQIVIEPGVTDTPITLHSFDGDGYFKRSATLNLLGGRGPHNHATVHIENVP